MSDAPVQLAELPVMRPNPFAGAIADPEPVAAPPIAPQFIANSAEDMFGPKPQHMAASPEAFFGPREEPGIVSRLVSYLPLLPDPADLMGGEKLKLTKPGEPARSVISPVIAAATKAFGPERLGISPETEQWFRDAGIFNDWQQEDASLWRTLNEAVIRSAAVPADAILRGVTAGFVSGQQAVYEALGRSPIGRDIAAIPEAFMGSPHPLGVPRGPSAAIASELADARALGVIGQGEAGWRGTADAIARERLAPADRLSRSDRIVERPVETAPDIAVDAPDIHAIARQIAPDTFTEFDALAARKGTFQGWLDDLAAQRDRGTSPELTKLDEQIDALRERRLAAPTRERVGLANQITTLEEQRARLIDDLPPAGDTPEMARIRLDLQETDYRMLDLAPEVSSAYRRAAEGEVPTAAEARPGEAPVEAAANNRQQPPETPTVAAERPSVAPERLRVAAREPDTGKVFIGEPGQIHADLVPDTAKAEMGFADANGNFLTRDEAFAALQPEAQRGLKVQGELDAADYELNAKDRPTATVAPPLEGGIAGDVSRQLVAAGRPLEEAQAAGSVVQALYETHAARFNGAKGTAEDLYRAEAPDVVRGRQRAAVEMARRGEPLSRELGQEALPPRITPQVRDRIRNLTVLDILDPETPALKARSRDVETIAAELEARGKKALRALGIKEGKITGPSPRTDEILSHAIATEVRAALQRSGHAGDWYTTKVEEAVATAARLYPEIATDPNARSAFTAALAVTSQGETVVSNVRLADQAYQRFRGNGRFPENVEAKNGAAMNANFAKLNDLIDRLGHDGAREFLSREFTVRDLERELGVKIGGENKDTKVYGSMILGPKIGQGFYQNLNGNFRPVTMDLWFMRAWGRLTGTLVGMSDEALAAQRTRLTIALTDAGERVPKTAKALEARAEAIVKEHEQNFRKYRAEYDSGIRAKPESVYAAERYLKGLHGINEQPSSGAQRVWMRDRINRAREILAEEGTDLTNADMQAAWWYPEKELHGKLGGRDAAEVNVDYSTAWRDVARSRGLSDAELPAEGAGSVRALDRRPGPAGTADDARAAAEVSRGRGEADGAQEFYQSRRGKIRLGDPEAQARATITLFRDADASTFIHETGHDWLERLTRDSADPQAPSDLVADVATVRDWLGVKQGEAIPTKAHEKFARGFERYLMEGHAPSARLAGVFEQFKRWLTDIYQRVTRLRAPINDDIRAVFDRMLATPEERAVVAAEREPGRAFADIHEGDIEATPPEHAVSVADTLEAERDRIAAEAPPEIERGRPTRQAAGIEDRGPEPGNRALDSEGDGAGSSPAGSGAGAEPGAVGARGNEAAAARPSASAGAATPEPASPNASFERAPEAGVTDKAGNIRLELLNAPEDVNTVLRQTAAENNDFLAERRNVISDAEVDTLADALGMDPATLNRRKIGEAFNAEEVVAARKLLIHSATTVRDAMRKAAGGSDADVLAYAEAKARHLMIQGQVSGITAEAGRALRAFRELEGSQEAKTLGQYLLKQATGRDLFQLREEAQQGLSLDTPQQVSKFVHDSAKPRLIDKALEVWINALLSGPKTHAVNMTSNALISLYSVPETAAAAAVGRVRQLLPGADAARVELGEAGARFWGIMQGAPEGVRAGWELLKNEDLALLERSKIERRGGPAIEGMAGKIIRIPGRLLGAEDKVFKGIAYRQELNAQAYRQAMQEGATGDRFAARVAELANDPPEAMIEAATARADYQTFNNALGTGGALLSVYANQFPVLRFVVPFIRTPINILKYSAERSPFGPLMREVRDNLAGKNGAIARDTQISRMALGTAVGLTGAYLATQGLLTGGGPSDPAKKAALRLTGWQPYSVKIGEMYYSFGRAEPLGTLLGVAGDIAEVAHAATSDEHESIAKMVFASISKNLTSKTWLKGPSDLIQAVTDPDRYGQNYIKGLAGTIVPSIVAQTTQATDPYLREARSIIDQIKSRIPGVSESLHPRRDVWGEPIERDEAGGPMGITGIALSKINKDPVNHALAKVGHYPAKLDREIRGVELTEDQYDELARIAGRTAKIRVNALVGMRAFEAMPLGVQREMVKKAIDESREMARGIVMMKNPEIISKALQNKKDQLSGAKR